MTATASGELSVSPRDGANNPPEPSGSIPAPVAVALRAARRIAFGLPPLVAFGLWFAAIMGRFGRGPAELVLGATVIVGVLVFAYALGTTILDE